MDKDLDYEDDYLDQYDGLEIYDDIDELDIDDSDFEDFEDDMDYEDFESIRLTLEDDTELQCLVVAEYEIDGQSYVALLPVDDEDAEILLYRANYTEDSDPFEVELIEDEDEFDLAVDAYYELVDSHNHECGCGHDHECGCGHDHECDCGHDHE